MNHSFLYPTIENLLHTYEARVQLLAAQIQALPKGSLNTRARCSGAILELQHNQKRSSLSVPAREILLYREKLSLRKELLSEFSFLKRNSVHLRKLISLYGLSFSEETEALLAKSVSQLSFSNAKVLPSAEPVFAWPDGVVDIFNLPVPFPEQRFYTTLKGDKVRSSAELVIADALFSAQLNYRYEPALAIHGKIVRPDFVVASPVSGDPIIWEHAGLVSSPKYAEQLSQKKELYASAGFYEGQQLLVTYTDSQHPLSSQYVYRILEAFFHVRM